MEAAVQAKQMALEAAWSKDLESEPKEIKYKSPVKRVIKLLRKMKDELVVEAENESSMYDKMVCWCETNEKEKTKAIADAEAKETDLEAEIEERAAKFGKIATEIEALKEQIAEDTETLKKATAMREKEAAGFRAEEKDMVQAITNLKRAIEVLKRHQGGSLLQENSPLLSGMRVTLRNIAMQYEMMKGQNTQSSRSHKATALLSVDMQGKKNLQGVDADLMNALDIHGHSIADNLPGKFAERIVEQSSKAAPTAPSAGAFLQQPGTYQSYSTRSNAIFGVMTQMLEEFEASLKSTQKTEEKSGEDYDALATAKEEQIALGKEKLDELETGHAENQKALSDAKEDLGLTREQRSKDVEFLRNLKLTCKDLDDQWQKRSATRSAEITAVSETISILTTDDAKELTDKTISFMQEVSYSSRAAMRVKRAKASAVLRRASQSPELETDDLLAAWRGRHQNSKAPRATLEGARTKLSTLALAVQLDSFKKVKAMMDKMVADLKVQQKEEVEFKAKCVAALDKTEKEIFDEKKEKKELETKISNLAALIEKLAKEIEEAKAQIADMEVEIKKASQNREKENAEYQTVVADQRATQDLLKKALSRLEDFYKKGKGKAVLVQASQEPPVKFNKYKTNAGASPVMGLIEQIVEDSVKLVDEAVTSEKSAQADYEQFVKDGNELIAGNTEAVNTKTKAVADAKMSTAEAKSELKSTIGELGDLLEYEADKHNECDWLIKNFDIRQKARMQEMEAIQEAKGILSGAAAE